jgi:hypothetical protein
MKLPKGPKINIPKGPKLSMPKLPSRKGGATEAKAKPVKPAKSAPKVQAPGFVNDLYRDLRDRRLILPAVALLVAIVAVPMALSSTSEPIPPAPAAAIPDDASAVAPAVVREQLVGVRDYRERLDDLKESNPFKQKFTIDETPDEEVVEVVPPPTPAPGGGNPTPTSEPVVAPDSSNPDNAPAPVDNDANNDSVPDNEILILSSRVDVKVGKIGEQKTIKDVKQGTILPERDTAIVMFLGANDDLTAAHFLVTGDVTASTGDGRCGPSAQDCQLLELKAGESRTFDYGPDGTKYRLKVTDILEKVVDKRTIDQG